MRILAIDTSTRFLSLGIYDDGRIYEYDLDIGPRLSSLLAVIIKRVLKALDLEAQDLDYFACGLGPGSFTGLRVGLSTMKGLSWSLRKPLIGIPTLDVLALNAQEYREGLVVPVIDARRDLIYSCFYRLSGDKLKKTSSYMLISKDDLLKKIKSPCLMLGDALTLYKNDIIKSLAGVIFLDKENWYPKARNIIKLALDRIKAGKFEAIPGINPFYIYPKECQIKK